MVTLTATADTHWEFAGWSGDLSGLTTPVTLTMDAPKTVTATFTLKQYALVTATVGNGSLAVEPAGGVYEAGTVVTLTATPDPEWNFAGWSGDLSGLTNPITLTMDAPKTVTATFTIKQYSLDINTVGSGGVGRQPGVGPYDSGTVVTLTATADTHWEFAGWSGGLERSDQSGDADDGRAQDGDGHVHLEAIHSGHGDSGQRQPGR